MDTYVIAIVDDEQKSIDEFKSYVERYFQENDGKYKIIEFYDGKELIDDYSAQFDIIFLDIEMKEMNGIRAAKKIRSVDSHTAIIFLTRMARYAIKGYDVQAIDFIVKPLDYDRFVQKFRKALNYVKVNETKMLDVKSANGMRYISARDIIYVEAMSHKIIYHTIDENLETYGTLKNIESQLKDSGFCPCNRCYLVNLRYINGITGNDVHINNGESLVISRHKKKDFLAAIARYYGQGRNG